MLQRARMPTAAPILVVRDGSQDVIETLTEGVGGTPCDLAHIVPAVQRALNNTVPPPPRVDPD